MPRGEGRTFKYARRTVEDVRERANMKGGDFDSVIKSKYKVFKPKDGKNIVRILPPTWEEPRHYGYDLWINYGIGVDNVSYLSLAKMKNEKDPLAEARKQAEREGDKELSKALQARQRIGMWVIDRNAEDEGPQIWLCPFTVDKDVINLSYDEDTKEVLFIDDPEEGMDFRFYKEGEGLKTKYPPVKMKIMKPSPIHEDEKLQKEWLGYITENPIPECLQFYDYEHIASTFDGQARIDKPEDEDDERPQRRRAKPAADDEDDDPPPRRRQQRPDPDEEEAEDHEDQRPLRRTRPGTRPEPDEDEEPAPRTRARLSKPAEDEDDKPAPSLRERLRQRRQPAEDDD